MAGGCRQQCQTSARSCFTMFAHLSPSLAFAFGLGLAACVAVGVWCGARAWQRRASHRVAVVRAARALAGEVRAAHMLQAAGYTIIGSQVQTTIAVAAGPTESAYGLRADFLVERGGQRFVAEVKTGDAAPLLGNVATRRQLLEYQIAFGVAAVLLVAPETGTITPVSFAMPQVAVTAQREPATAWRWAWRIAVASALGWWLARW